MPACEDTARTKLMGIFLFGFFSQDSALEQLNVTTFKVLCGIALSLLIRI